MKKYLAIISTSILLVSCASSNKPTEGKKLDDIAREDFKAVKPVAYNRKDDKLVNVKSQYTAASNAESIERIMKYDGDVELKGEIGSIARYCYENEFSRAYDLVQKLNKKYINNPIFWNQVGTCFLLEGNRRKALLFFNKAISIRSSYTPSLNNLGVMYMREMDYSRALVAFTKAKESNTFARTPRLNLSNLYLNFGLYEQAISELNSLYKMSNKDVDVLSMLGTSYLMANDAKRAREYFILINKDLLEEVHIGLNFAMTEFELGNKERARDLYDDIDTDKLGTWSEYYKAVGKIIKE